MKGKRYLTDNVEELGDHLIQGSFSTFSLSVGRITPAKFFSTSEALAITEALDPSASLDLA